MIKYTVAIGRVIGGKTMRNAPFIAIEGPIGIGKTSLANKISAHFNFYSLKEIVEENPFLEKFYDNIDEWSFQTEMFFLCNRFKQLEDLEVNYLKQNKPVVADYHIFKNMIFAKRTLPQDKYKKYEKIYHILTDDMPKPNLIIYIHANIDTIMKRIKQRGRELEHNIQRDYIKQLAEDYDLYLNEFESRYPDIPVIRIDGDEYDFIKYQHDLDHILKVINDKIEKHINA